MIVAEHFGFVVGIDTHAKTHALAIINTPSGGEIANETFPANGFSPCVGQVFGGALRRCRPSASPHHRTPERLLERNAIDGTPAAR